MRFSAALATEPAFLDYDCINNFEMHFFCAYINLLEQTKQIIIINYLDEIGTPRSLYVNLLSKIPTSPLVSQTVIFFNWLKKLQRRHWDFRVLTPNGSESRFWYFCIFDVNKTKELKTALLNFSIPWDLGSTEWTKTTNTSIL